jgi:hypothetical protein
LNWQLDRTKRLGWIIAMTMRLTCRAAGHHIPDLSVTTGLINGRLCAFKTVYLTKVAIMNAVDYFLLERHWNNQSSVYSLLKNLHWYQVDEEGKMTLGQFKKKLYKECY